MAQAKIIDQAGKVTGNRDLPDALFGGEVNVPLLHQVVMAQMAGIRSGTASTKTRSEVRGGGKKPWRQKGTGRARHGSTRSPIWVGGGVVFGPKPRSYAMKVPKKMRQAALRSALASKANDGVIWVLDDFTEAKTKTAAACLKAAEIGGRTLIVVNDKDEGAESVHRAFRNLGRSAFCFDRSLNTHDVIRADHIVFTMSAYENFIKKAEVTS
ncbi:MAG: 50S ribosomal protein L4 [Actinobacteria bacterium]|nr:50S ribosomal protein L4 [Actinomycetota bacterium]